MSDSDQLPISEELKEELDDIAAGIGLTKTMEDDDRIKTLKQFAKRSLTPPLTDSKLDNYLNLPSTRKLLKVKG